jgi:hypothetical protein
MPHAQHQADLIKSLHLESLFEAMHLSAPRAAKKAAAPAACVVPRDPHCRLADAILRLTIPTDSWVSPCPAATDADTAHAAANVEDWLSYLPKDCVRAMVCDGWQWTT